MKIALVTDTHLGVRNDNEHLALIQDEFWTKQFFPELISRGITKVIHLGDFFDKRQYLTTKTMDRCRNMFIPALESWGGEWHQIVGNHDVTYKNSNDLNSPELLLDHKQITIYTQPKVISDNLIMMPWINHSNMNTALKFLKEQNPDSYVFGHFEFAGFPMHKGGMDNGHGMDYKIFESFNGVFSGHYHTSSVRNNVTYLGTPFEMTWSDWNDEKGWWVFDTSSGDLDFIKTEGLTLFYRIEYTDGALQSSPTLNADSYQGKYIKVLVRDRSDEKRYTAFIDQLNQSGAIDVQIVDMTMVFKEIESSEIETMHKNTLELTLEYIESAVEDDRLQEELKEYMTEIYSEVVANGYQV